MTTAIDTNFDDLLGIPQTATETEIRKAYKKKALSCHLDKAALNHLTVEKATEVFKKVQAAYSILSDPQHRRMYDLSLNTPSSSDLNKIVQFFIAHDIDKSKKDRFGRTVEEVIYEKNIRSSWDAIFKFYSKFSQT